MSHVEHIRDAISEDRVRVLRRMGVVVRMCIACGCHPRAITAGSGVDVSHMVSPHGVRVGLDAAGRAALDAVPRLCQQHVDTLRDGRCKRCYQAAWEAAWKRLRTSMGCTPGEAARLLAWLDWVLVAHAHAYGEATIDEVVRAGQSAREAGCDPTAWAPGGLS